MVRSTSLATYTVASMNWSNCWDSLATASTSRTVSTLPRHLMDASSSSWATWLIAVPALCRFFASSHSLVQSGQAFCVPGNHDMKLVRALRGRDVKRTLWPR